MKAVNRWLYSMMEWYSRGGSHRSVVHLGQPEHPNPDPVARTSPPMAISRKVVAVAAMESPRSHACERPLELTGGPAGRCGTDKVVRPDMRQSVSLASRTKMVPRRGGLDYKAGTNLLTALRSGAISWFHRPVNRRMPMADMATPLTPANQ